MDSCLTQTIAVQLPPWQPYSKVPEIKGYSQVTSLTPIVKEFYGTQATTEGQFQSNNLFGKLTEFYGSGRCSLITAQRKQKKAFCKVTHLLDPIRTIQLYYENSEKGKERKERKLTNPMNQAYVDALASYLLGQIVERNLSPHFCLFYGGYQAIADVYRYDITSDFASFRKYRAFWERRRKGVFGLYIDVQDRDEDDEEDEDETYSWLGKTPTSSLHSDAFSYKTPKSKGSQKSHISLEDDLTDLSGGGMTQVDLQSVDSFPSAEGSVQGEDKSEEDDSDATSFYEDSVNVYAEFKQFPVMLIFQEEMTAPLDDLLEDEEEVGADIGTQGWEDRWTAWTFQVIAALCAAQGVLGFTHNDLHTNNIVYKETDIPYLYYRARDGTIFRVPTYGKLFRIIDFGRAIFRVSEAWFISDDYETGGDADGQYNFGPRKNEKHPESLPNPSFDLCRYAVSILDAVFPEMPAENLEGLVLSKEEAWEIRETESPLWNLLWSWLLDDEGRNVLRDEDGTERFPDFDLYQHITTHVHNAKPQDSLWKEAFKGYRMKEKDIGDWETVYPLFC